MGQLCEDCLEMVVTQNHDDSVYYHTGQYLRILPTARIGTAIMT